MKTRLDVLVAERFSISREKAKALIMAGNILADGEKADKAGMTLDDSVELRMIGETMAYVSRGGLKLEKAMQVYPIHLQDAICIDIGASTGGFTDCMLQNGAQKVYAVDVGYGQLAWKLRTDERVVNLERTNIRYVTEEQVPDPLDFGSIDVSFISLTLVLPVLFRLLKDGGSGVCLIKPQFEAGKGKVGKKGVVREPEIHLEVLEKIYDFCAQIGFSVQGIDYSPIKGPEGNIEYLFYLVKNGENTPFTKEDLKTLVAASHQALDQRSV